MKPYFRSMVEQSVARSKEATLSILGITNPQLREHLAQQMSAESGEEGAFLAPPVFETTFGWEEAAPTMADLAGTGKLLRKEVVAALDSKQNGRYRFGSHFHPFSHQLVSWKTLLEQKRSIIVTSGTGSGKTECFMVPVLNDLYEEFQQKKAPLVGVRALFLYPLNALINSQRERLAAWTQNFGNNIRYCLYNGNTEEHASKVRTLQKDTNEVLSRELLRQEPAPILVTNGTMLEYMMVRQVDAPIVEISRQQKSLRWIVLDEAHTYVGSQAAELALQLRRVLHAFGVEAKDVRFVATSATIADDNAEQQLKKFLSDLTGVSPEQIEVIGGQRQVPTLSAVVGESLSLDAIEAIDADETTEVSPERFQALVNSREARALRHVLINAKKPLQLNEIARLMSVETGAERLSQQTTLRWLDVASGTKPTKDDAAFLKLRAHFFQRMTHGLWSCVDPKCSAKQGTALKATWPYGNVYVNQRQRCNCGSLVLELSFCQECNEPHLLARDKQGSLIQWDSSGGDEFSLQHEATEEQDKTEIADLSSTAQWPLMLAATHQATDCYVPINIDKVNGEFLGATGERVTLKLLDGGNTKPACANCNFSGYNHGFFLRRALLGAPFYVANAVPTILEYCPDHELEKGDKIGPQMLPGRGRKLITFTDSRQGAARMAVRMQQEAERSRLRGLVIEVLRQAQKSQPKTELPKEGVQSSQLLGMASHERSQAKIYESMGLFDEADESKRKAESLEAKVRHMQGEAIPEKLSALSWNKLATELREKSDLSSAILAYNHYLSPEVFDKVSGPYQLAEMLLFREFMRRPKRQNSLETQGLVKVSYQGLESINTAPEYWAAHDLTLDDWLDFLKVSLDFHVRENSFIQLEASWRDWIGSRFSSKYLRTPMSKEDDEMRVKRWPQIREGRSGNRLIKLLLLGANLDPKSPKDVDTVNLWLNAAWLDLTQRGQVLKSDGNQFYLPRENLTFSFNDKAYICPVTHKLIDTTFKGLTPYLPGYMDFASLTEDDKKSYRCPSIELPTVWQFGVEQEDYQLGLAKVREQVKSDDNVQALRSQNLWTDINDRAVEGGFYYRTAEHSAQQSAERLDSYESQFKKGKINVLNCSTTMEMGVDIGGVSAVVMNNVPPHPANYLQRAGRAGRSKESRALAYTLCKSNPHDKQVFANPSWPFETLIPAPSVALNSVRLVQRHVNSLLLSIFLRERVGRTTKEKTSLNTEWFYHGDDSICAKFINWLSSSDAGSDAALKVLVKGTALASHSPSLLREAAIEKITELRNYWLKEYEFLQTELSTAQDDTPFSYRLKMELARLCGEYLLRDLAAKTFLPGYGFPTDVVNFDNNNIEDFIRFNKSPRKEKEDREDNISRYRGLPSRNLAIAIREYAPGAEIVLDGRVFRSAGVSLHWHNVSDISGHEAQKFDLAWRCDHCGQTGYETSVQSNIGDLCCSNIKCQQPIKGGNTRKVLQPSGFATDFYESPTNDINHQRYIQVQPAWVSVKSDYHPLPNSLLGSMAYGADGHVFHHSSGDAGTGYALCMSCGRAESLDKNGDFPKTLSPDKDHFPLRASKSDKDSSGHRLPCEGSARLMPSVHLGFQARTDVFELILRHPQTHEYLPEQDEQSKIIAVTLAVALRSALAGILGISTSELGYATRPMKLESGHGVTVLQLFDVISGGAGFSSSAALHIEDLLAKMVDNLHCTHCETSCSECLLDSQSRHDHDKLDRTIALNWLGNDFKRFIGLPENEQLLEKGRYYPGTIEEVVREQVNKGADRLSVWLKGDVRDWDLMTPQFRRVIEGYLIQNNVKVELVLPVGDIYADIRQDLLHFVLLGVTLHTATQNNSAVSAQLFNGHDIITVACSESLSSVPDKNWHQSRGIVVTSTSEAKYTLQPISTSGWSQSVLIGSTQLEVTEQFNGIAKEFGDRFWTHLQESNAELKQLLLNDTIESIHYTDRYLQNPASLILLGDMLLPLCKDSQARVTIETSFKNKDRTGHLLFHDWDCEDEFKKAYLTLFKHLHEVDLELTVHHSNEHIAHRRRLTLTFQSGKQALIRLDQGVGYWRLQFNNWGQQKFDFSQALPQQMIEVIKAREIAEISNSSDWSTDIICTIS